MLYEQQYNNNYVDVEHKWRNVFFRLLQDKKSPQAVYKMLSNQTKHSGILAGKDGVLSTNYFTGDGRWHFGIVTSCLELLPRWSWMPDCIERFPDLPAVVGAISYCTPLLCQ